MKRTITAAIAAATALSLAVVPAQAETPKKPELSASQQQGEKKESSSKISNEDAIKEALQEQKNIEVRGFGTFKIRHRKT